MVSTEHLDIICITETWIKTDGRDFEGEFFLPGYTMFKRDRELRAGGGVVIYARNHLNAQPIPCDSPYEIVGVKIRGHQTMVQLFAVYRPPRQVRGRDLEMYDTLGRLLQDETSIIVGDFNCRVNWDTDGTVAGEGTRLIEFKNEHYLTQMVRHPTRGANTLDLVFTTDEDLITQVEVGEHLGNSDHKTVFCRVGILVEPEDPSYRVRPNLRRADFERFNRNLRDLQPQPPGTVEEMWSGFKANFLAIQADCIPNKQVGGTAKVNPKWYNPTIDREIKERKRLYRIQEETPTEACKARYTQKRTEVKRIVRRAKVAEEHRVALACKDNPKEFFGYVNSRKPVRARLGPLRTDQGMVTSDAGVANEFNRYFASVFTAGEDDDIPAPDIIYDGEDRLLEIQCTEEEIANKVGKLDPSKAPGSDGFLPKVLKSTKAGVVPHLLQIFNKSLEEGEVPDDMRMADVTPIHKKGPVDLTENFRPISLTSVPGRILESIVKDNMVVHLEQHNLITDSQHGFRSGRSCLTNLLEFFNHMLAEFDRSRAIDVVYLDFKKAFDKVPHKRLLAKVEALGIGGTVLRWLKSWLNNRKQRVVVNGASSEFTAITSGVPQGSVLGPLLFLIYINDLDSGLVSRVAKFADDTKLGACAADPEAIRGLQTDLAKVGDWSDKWLMPFNNDKCHVLHFGTRNPRTAYTLQGSPVSEAASEKDLGVLITNDLKFSAQCIAAEKKANRILGYIKRQFNYRNKQTVLTLYHALVRPILEYAVQFWSPTLVADITRLEKVQARATKLIPEIRHKGYQRRLNDLGLFTLEKRRLRGQLIETFKILKGFDKVDHNLFFTLNENPTRNHGWKVIPPRYHTAAYGNIMTVRICNVWNRLPEVVVNSNSVESFKRRLDRVLPDLHY